jgi:hypothetical protein
MMGKSMSLFLASVLVLSIAVAGMLISSRNSFGSVSMVEAAGGIVAYWDKECRNPVKLMDWGLLVPGQTKNQTLYVRNEGNETMLLVETTANWSSSSASRFLAFSWYASDRKLDAGKVVSAVQTLKVSLQAKDISTFGFDIIFKGMGYFLGDINKDGTVNGKDVAIIALSYGATPRSPNWNPDADLNKDGIIDGQDVAVVSKDFGRT